MYVLRIFNSFLLEGKYCRGVTEMNDLKAILTNGEYIIIQWLI